jgi:hypothetical protein
MLAIVGLVLYVIAAILKLTDKYPNALIWLIIIGGALVAIDVAWGWNARGRRYRA